MFSMTMKFSVTSKMKIISFHLSRKCFQGIIAKFEIPVMMVQFMTFQKYLDFCLFSMSESFIANDWTKKIRLQIQRSYFNFQCINLPNAIDIFRASMNADLMDYSVKT